MHWRRRLPHWVPDESIVFITWRLAGTLPQPPPAILTNGSEPNHRPGRASPAGPHWLKEPRVAAMFIAALLHGEARGLYTLSAWVIMPNHVHLVLKPHCPLPAIMRWLKTATAMRANRITGRTGKAFWQREYFDRWIRSGKELASVIAYVENNPVRVGLAETPEQWPWSSAASLAHSSTAESAPIHLLQTTAPDRA